GRWGGGVGRGGGVRLTLVGFLEVRQERPDHRTIGRLQYHQWDLEAPGTPEFSEPLSRRGIYIDHDGRHIIRERTRKLQRCQGPTVQPGDRYHDFVRFRSLVMPPLVYVSLVQCYLLAHVDVVLVHRTEHHHQSRNEQDDNPGTLRELAFHYDTEHHTGCHRAKSIDDGLGTPAPFPRFEPVAYH